MSRVHEGRRMHNLLWGLKPSASHNPAPTPVSLQPADLRRIAAPGAYVATEKTDGVRMTLVFCADRRDKPFAVGFERSGRVACVLDQVRAPRVAIPGLGADVDLFEGTLLDVERVRDGSFVLLDAMVVGGYDLKREASFERRLDAGRAAAAAVGGGVRVRTKPFVPVDQIHTLRHRDVAGVVDGLVFVPTRAPVQRGRHRAMFKYKSRATLDVLWDHDRAEWCFADRDARVPVHRCFPDMVIVSTAAERGAVTAVFEIAPINDVEEGQVGRPYGIVGVRPDKGVAPNQVDTVRATIHVPTVDYADIEAAVRDAAS